MTVVTVDNLHTCEDPRARLHQAASIARVQAGSELSRVIVRVPDRDTQGLRVFQLQDVARLLQREGRIEELAVTDGGTIVAAADVINRRGQLAIWTGPAIGPWSPRDIMERGLGGSETAAYRLAEELARMGWAVTLYGDFAQPGLIEDVLLEHYATWDPTQHLDALVIFRDARPLEHRPNADFVGLWLEDLAPAEGLTPARAANCDKVIGVTSWHKEQILREHPWMDPSQVVAGRNGIVTRWYTEEPAPEREKRVVCSSSPDRGADIVLEVWPEIRERVPDAELICTYPAWFDICADTFQAANQHRERLRELVQQPGVTRLDRGMGQKQLANLLRASLVWVNCGYYTPGRMKFDETSCISAMEAQAAGCAVVGPNWGAITETVLHGTLIDGDPGEKDGAWRKQFVDAVVAGLADENVQAAAQVLGPEYMRDMDWRGAAEQLASLFVPPRVRANFGAIYR